MTRKILNSEKVLGRHYTEMTCASKRGIRGKISLIFPQFGDNTEFSLTKQKRSKKLIRKYKDGIILGRSVMTVQGAFN